MGELGPLIRRQRAAGEQFLRVYADRLLGEAQRIVPLEEGTLAASGDVIIDEHPNGADAMIIFSTAYARRQHDDLEYRHREGRQAKYLEEPAKRLAPTFPRGLAATLRQVT